MENPIQKRILVVDDEEPVRIICTRVLTPLGYYVETAADGHEAMERLEKRDFDLVITDYCMPGGWNGLALAQAIKQRFPDIRIIIMTAFPAIDNAVETLRIGASDYLVKPFEQAELIQRVKACFAPQSVP